jgi:hypothetical protein
MKNGNPLQQNQDITMDPPKSLPQTSPTVTLGKTKRCWVFVFIILVNTFINFDHGYFPAATEEFKRDYKISSSLLGLFGSSVYLGNLIGRYFIT